MPLSEWRQGGYRTAGGIWATRKARNTPRAIIISRPTGLTRHGTSPVPFRTHSYCLKSVIRSPWATMYPSWKPNGEFKSKRDADAETTLRLSRPGIEPDPTGLSRVQINKARLPAVGVEPTLPYGNKILSLARLPISPRRLVCYSPSFSEERGRSFASALHIRKRKIVSGWHTGQA